MRVPPLLTGRTRTGRLLCGLALLACCSNNTPPVGGLLSSPAGMALANSLLFLANQDGNELHVFDTNLQQFRPSPNLMFPLSVPTVRAPGAVCGNASEIFTISSVDATLGVIDAFDDSTNADPADPPLGLRELGEIALPGLASDAVCTPEPSAVLAHKIAVAKSPAQYAAEVATGGALDVDGGLAERLAVAALPMAALLTFNDPELICSSGACSGTQIWEVTNDISGVACDAGAPAGVDAFCPSLKPLFALPPQPAECEPVGPPLAQRVDVSGANAGDVNLGVPNVDPSTLNRLMAADQNSNCVASVNLDDMSVDWFYANGPSTEVFAMPYVPGSCLPGGDLFAATFAGEQCERQGPPPVGGYQNCGGVSFLSVGGGGLLPEPLPYPFTPRRPMPPVRIVGGFVQKVAFVGPDVSVTAPTQGFINTVPFQMLAMVGTGSGSIVYVDIGIGRPDAGTGADDAGQFACPAAYLAPRVVDINDYITNPIPPEISEVAAAYFDGGPGLGEVTQLASPVALTAAGGATPTTDRLDAGFSTPLGTNGLAMPQLSCYSLPIGSQICMTSGMVQKGAAEAETFVVTYEGSLPGLGGVPGSLTGSSLQIPSAGDLTQIAGGLLSSEGVDGGNLLVQLANDSVGCGAYGISAVTAGSLTLSSLPICAAGTVNVTVVASGRKPYTVEGTTIGFLNQLWPDDGTLHLVVGKRWHYPADLIGMLHGAEQLADYVLGPIQAQAAPGSTLTYPRKDGADSDALDSSFGLALSGPLGIAAEPDAGTGVIMQDGGPAVAPLPGAYWSFNVSNGIIPLSVNPTGLDPQSADALIDGMAAYTSVDAGSVLVPHVFASYRGGNAMVELVPTDGDSSALAVFH